MARVRRELIRSPSQKGAGGGCIDPSVKLRATVPTVNPVERRSWVYAPSSALYTDARPILSAFAISVATMLSAFMARTLATGLCN